MTPAAADRAFVVQTCLAMIADGDSVDRIAGRIRRPQQAPGAKHVAGLEHEVPVQLGMVVLQDNESWHRGLRGGRREVRKGYIMNWLGEPSGVSRRFITRRLTPLGSPRSQLGGPT